MSVPSPAYTQPGKKYRASTSSSTAPAPRPKSKAECITIGGSSIVSTSVPNESSNSDTTTPSLSERKPNWSSVAVSAPRSKKERDSGTGAKWTPR